MTNLTRRDLFKRVGVAAGVAVVPAVAVAKHNPIVFGMDLAKDEDRTVVWFDQPNYNEAMRQLLDSAKFASSPGGFNTDHLRKKGEARFIETRKNFRGLYGDEG